MTVNMATQAPGNETTGWGVYWWEVRPLQIMMFKSASSWAEESEVMRAFDRIRMSFLFAIRLD